ncbi:YceI family protein [Tenacibaculum agarivorans]|uniref:YceI family protein n=1 Tax=Tenacibaculum agarivorans TaxID=1908389 RepID=UPI00094BB438|nr:YceI family protein [Tenacibaculum agarivorans]
MNRLVLLTFLAFSVLSSNAQKLIQNESRTMVTFKIKNFGSYVDCIFTKVKFEGSFDQNDLANSYINAIIDVSSVDTNNTSRNKSIAKEKYFHVAKYPNITLKSTKIEMVDTNLYNLIGDLTIKGTTKKVTIPIKISEKDNQINISSDFTINRLDYNVGKGSLILSKKVVAKVNYLASK